MQIESLSSLEPEVRELLPVFLGQGHEHLRRMDKLMARGDLEGLKRLGHVLKGSGAMYGLGSFETLGRTIEEAARSNDRSGLETCQRQWEDLLKALENALSVDRTTAEEASPSW